MTRKSSSKKYVNPCCGMKLAHRPDCTGVSAALEVNAAKAMPEHTPTPWHIEPSASESNILNQENLGIATMANPYPLGAADAAFIVRAVNTFEASQAENERLRNSHEELVDFVRWIASARAHVSTGVLKEAKLLLAQAETHHV